jgi:hypothetical protein
VDLQAIGDKLEIQEQLARYARGVDTRDCDMFYNPMQLPGMETSSATGGYYHHEFVRTAGGWKSAHLVEELVWFLNGPAA